MKKILTFIAATLTLISCTEEVNIDEVLNPTDIRLVIEANMDISKTNTSGISTQSILLSKTTSFYTPQVNGVAGATISLTDKDGNSVGTFLDINPGVDNIENGTYTAIDFVTPEIGETYYLTVTVEGNTYTAEETYHSIEDINDISQKDLDIADNFKEINANIDNVIGVDNYYLFEYQNSNYAINEYDAGDDAFVSEVEGKNNFDFTYIDELVAGDILDIKVMGISKSYYNYMNKLITISQGSNGPFSTAPSTVRGNIINNTDLENYALGYFSLNQYVEETYTITEEESK